MVSLLRLTSNTWPNSGPLLDIRLLSDLKFDLSMLLKVKCHGTTGAPYMVSFNV